MARSRRGTLLVLLGAVVMAVALMAAVPTMAQEGLSARTAVREAAWQPPPPTCRSCSAVTGKVLVGIQAFQSGPLSMSTRLATRSL